MTALSPASAPGTGATRPVRLGRVDYVNVLPVYMGLEQDGTACELVRGVPTALNRALREGAVDCAPVSAVEVAHAEGRYAVLEGLSIASRGAVGSSLLVSRRPPAELDGARLAMTTHSAASLAYVQVLCARLWRITPEPVAAEPDLDAMLATADACVLIGNPALTAAAVAEQRGDLVVTDIGAAWAELTGLPCVFAVWALHRDRAAAEPGLAALLRDELLRGRAWGRDPAHRAALDHRAAAETGLGIDRMHAYLDLQDYELTEEHRRGLARLFAELHALDLAPAPRPLELLA